MSYIDNGSVFATAGGIREISFAEIDLVSGGGQVADYATHIAAVAGITAGVATGMGCVPVAVGAGVVCGVASLVAVFG